MKYDTDELTQLRADLARVTAEREESRKRTSQLMDNLEQSRHKQEAAERDVEDMGRELACSCSAEELRQVRAELAKVTAERDEAAGDLHKFRTTYELWPNHRDIVASLRAELAKVTAERDAALRTKDQSLEVIRNQSLHLGQQETELAALRARVAELERDVKWNREIGTDAAAELTQERERVAELEQLLTGSRAMFAGSHSDHMQAEQRNAELVAALQAAENYLRPYAEIHDLPKARRIAERLARILARAESATPAPSLDEEIARRANNGTLDAAMRTPAPHADTVRLDWIEKHGIDCGPYDCGGYRAISVGIKHFGYGDTLRAAIDAAMEGSHHD